MVERLSDEERKIIGENWNTIKNQVLEQSYSNIEIGDLTIKACIINEKIKLIIKKKEKRITTINASINSRKMKFKYYSEKKQAEIEEYIYYSSSIIYFTKKLKMQHPIFQKQTKDNIEEESVTEHNVEEIFDNPEINEIIDDNFDATISEEHFNKYKEEDGINISEYYDEFSFQEYSKLAEIIEKNLTKNVTSKARTQLSDFIGNLDLIKSKIIVLAGAQKIGISFSILQTIKDNYILYIDLNTLFNLKRSDKRKYVFIKFMNLFLYYKDYNEFIKENILALQGYNNILSIIENMIPILAKKLEKVNIIIDNYDDYLVGDKKLSNDYLDKDI